MESGGMKGRRDRGRASARREYAPAAGASDAAKATQEDRQTPRGSPAPVIAVTRTGPATPIRPEPPDRPARTGPEIPVATPLRPVRSREYQLLTDAHRARTRGKARAAIRLYRRLLVENPANLEVALRVAPMLACAGEPFEAWQLYRRVAMDYARARQYSECLAVYREACRFVPGEFEAWRLCAELQLKMKKPEGAFETLIEGRMHFGGPNQRGQAIALLTRAREIEPWDDDLLIDLAALYAASDQPELALELLATLALRVQGPMLRRVRALQLRLTGSPRFAWLWLRSFGRSESLPPAVERDFEPIVESLAEVIESPPRLRRVSTG